MKKFTIESYIPVATEGLFLYWGSSCDSISQAMESIMNYIDWYSHERPHSRLNRQTPQEAFTARLPAVPMAALSSKSSAYKPAMTVQTNSTTSVDSI